MTVEDDPALRGDGEVAGDGDMQVDDVNAGAGAFEDALREMAERRAAMIAYNQAIMADVQQVRLPSPASLGMGAPELTDLRKRDVRAYEAHLVVNEMAAQSWVDTRAKMVEAIAEAVGRGGESVTMLGISYHGYGLALYSGYNPMTGWVHPIRSPEPTFLYHDLNNGMRAPIDNQWICVGTRLHWGADRVAPHGPFYAERRRGYERWLDRMGDDRAAREIQRYAHLYDDDVSIRAAFG